MYDYWREICVTVLSLPLTRAHRDTRAMKMNSNGVDRDDVGVVLAIKYTSLADINLL